MTMLTRLLLIVLSFTAAFSAGTIAHAAIARAAVTATPAQEWAACSAAYSLRGHQLEHARVPSSAWRSAWHAAGHADPGMEHDVHAWMLTGRGWFRVRYDCNPDA